MAILVVLEFVAASINIVTFCGMTPSPAQIVAEVDSLATALALTQDSAKSPLMVFVHQQLLVLLFRNGTSEQQLLHAVDLSPLTGWGRRRQSAC